MSENLCSLERSFKEWFGGFERCHLLHFEGWLWDYIPFNFIIHLLSVITFPLALRSVKKAHQFSQSFQPVQEEMSFPEPQEVLSGSKTGERSTLPPDSGRVRWSLGQLRLSVSKA